MWGVDAGGHRFVSLGSLRETGRSKVVARQPPATAIWIQHSIQAVAVISPGCSQPMAEQSRWTRAELFCPIWGSFDFFTLGWLISLARVFMSGSAGWVSSYLILFTCLTAFKCQAGNADSRLFLPSPASSPVYPSQAFPLRQGFMSDTSWHPLYRDLQWHTRFKA